MKTPNLTRIALGSCALLSLALTACSPKGFVEGVVFDQEFTIRDDQPAARESRADTIYIVLSQEDGDRFRTVTIEVEGYESVELGAPIAISVDDAPGAEVKAADGELVVDELSDGRRLVSSKNAVFADIVSGTVVLDSVDDVLAGSLDAELASGGYIRGNFVIER